MDLLSGWYPGLGEVETIRRMSPLVQEFIADAVAEDEDFLQGYLLPILERPEPEWHILGDLEDAVCDLEFEEVGLGGFGNLGKSFFKKVKKAVKKVRAKVQKAILPKSVAKAVQRVEAKVSKAVTKAAESVKKTGKKVWKRYGNIIIGAVGLVLVPFTGGASLAAASALTAVNQAYMKKRAADAAKRAARADAGQLTAQADQDLRAAEQQLDAFYSQNQQWFVDNLELTPDKWAQLTFDQKVDILQNGMAGRVPGNAPPPRPVDTTPMPAPPPPPPPPSGGGYAPTAAGSGGGGGLYPEGTSSSGFMPYGGQQQPGQQVATASMFDNTMLPLLAGGVALALIFGKPMKGGSRRAKRNPGRRRRRVA